MVGDDEVWSMVGARVRNDDGIQRADGDKFRKLKVCEIPPTGNASRERDLSFSFSFSKKR
jgi:hypothetical protein